MNARDFAGAVLLYCKMTGASVTSWARTPAHNKQVGGVPNSAHLEGLAVDVVYDAGGDLAEREKLCTVLELRRIVEGDHDHLQPLEWRA